MTQQRILHVVANMDPRLGGVCQAIRSLIASMTTENITNEVVCLDDPHADYLTADIFKIHALGAGRGAWCYHPDLIPWLEQHWLDYDRVILHGLWLYPNYAALRVYRRLLALNSNTPDYYVFTHGMLDPWFQSWARRPAKTLRNIVYWHMIEKQVINKSQALLFTCAEEQRLAGTTFSGYRPSREMVVGLGIEKPLIQKELAANELRSTFPHLANKPYLLFLSRINIKKGIDLLLKAYASIDDGGREPLPELVIAGPCDDEDYWQSLQELAVRLGLQQAPQKNESQRVMKNLCPKNHVHWVGMLTGNLKWGALQHADAFVLASHQENFGIAVVEALAVGTPVLISNKVNIWTEIVTAGAGLAEDDTESGTRELLIGWQKLDAHARADFQSRARDCFKSRFEISSTTRRLLETLGLR